MRRVVPFFVLLAVLGIAISATASPRGGGVRILKIVFDPPGADNGSNASLNKETAAIVNGGTSSVVMTGWTLRDRDNHVFRFPVFTLRPGGRVTIHNGQGTDNAANLFWDSGGRIWNNDGDAPTLRRRNGSRVDSDRGRPRGRLEDQQAGGDRVPSDPMTKLGW
jgi:hypothetical protein